jgi:hypothetical protein
MIPNRAYFIITGEQAAAHPELFDRPEVGIDSAATLRPMPASGDYLGRIDGVGTDASEVAADGLESVAAAVISRIKGALMSKRRAHARVYGEHLFAENTVAELVAMAGEQGVDLTGLTLKRDIVRAFMRDRYQEVATPKLTTAQAASWADGKTGAQLSAWAKARGLYLDHAPDKATAIQWLLTAEGYQ